MIVKSDIYIRQKTHLNVPKIMRLLVFGKLVRMLGLCLTQRRRWGLMPSGTWRCIVWYVGTDVSEEPAACILRVKEGAERET
jgi:hypothetical protein